MDLTIISRSNQLTLDQVVDQLSSQQVIDGVLVMGSLAARTVGPLWTAEETAVQFEAGAKLATGAIPAALAFWERLFDEP